ncbi:MAG TPA: transcriptional regulator [Candidatus Dwaynia gallinarum]|nr:hypothetical protein A6P36_06155 [Candidatus Arthromitus sp. SFB-turkey]HJD00426.1 transcriptional regulator [Candidatus Dwaynia gallinarum]
MIKIRISNTKERLKQIMETKKLKQIDILNLTKPISTKYKIKLNKSDLSQYLSGKVEPNQHKLFILSEALNVNVVWLMGYDITMEKLNNDINYNIDLIIKNKYGEDCLKTIKLYSKLDHYDRGEIRGEIKHMLKSKKYSTIK